MWEWGCKRGGEENGNMYLGDLGIIWEKRFGGGIVWIGVELEKYVLLIIIVDWILFLCK